MKSSSALSKRKRKEINLDDGTDIQEQPKDYKSTFDFKKYDVVDIKESLIMCEEAVVFHSVKSNEHKFKIAEALYKANQSLANRKNGVYVAWCENLQITRNKSADFINAYQLYLETGDKKAISLPVRVVRDLNKNKADLNEKELKKVVAAEKPGAAMEKIMLHSATLSESTKEILEAEIVETKEDKVKRLQEEAKFLEKDIKERKKNLRIQEEKLKGIYRELENSNNKQIPGTE